VTIDVSVRRIRLELSVAQIRTQAMAASRRRVVDVTRKVLNQATVDCPVDTGNLRVHHRQRIVELAGRVVGTVYNDAVYAAAVHDGSRQHMVRPVRAKVLAFDGDDGTAFAAWANIPAREGRPWLTKAASKVAAREGVSFDQ